MSRLTRGAGAVNISLLGDKELQSRLDGLEPAVAKKIVRKAIRVIGNDIRNDARALAPVKTGALRRSIKVRAIRRSRGRMGVIVRTGTREELGIENDDKGYYPAVQEYGSETVPARPYLRPALDHNQEKGVRKMARLIGELIETEAERRRVVANGN
jgi:HK97 gp10 family phage protein